MTEKEASPHSLTAMPGMLLDMDNKIAVAVVTGTTVGVCLRRFDSTPLMNEVAGFLDTEKWLLVTRERGTVIHAISPDSEDAEQIQVKSDLEKETALLTFQLALFIWPEWGEKVRGRVPPRFIIPIPSEVIQA